MACHQHRPYQADEHPGRRRSKRLTPTLRTTSSTPAATYDPKNFPASVRDRRDGEFRPEPVEHRGQVPVQASGPQWLANWIHAPEKYHPKSLMPNLQLSLQDAADIASWIISVPGEWPVTVEVPGVEAKEVKDAVDELVKLYVTKSGSFKKPDGKIGRPSR